MPDISDKKTNDTVLACIPDLSLTTLIKGASLLLLFLAAFSAPITLLVKEWADPDFSHGVLVPFVSLYFIWLERDRLKGVPVKPDYPAGLALIAAAALVLMAGKSGRMAVAEEASILIMIPGLVFLLLGRRYARVLTLPLAYLAFMVPLINPFIDKVHWPFQIFTAKFASVLLPYFGVSVYQRMQFLELPNITLEVAKGCSGVKFMVSIYAIAIPLAYFTQRGWLKKAILMALAFIIGVFTNGIRVTLIGVWTYFHLGNTLHGPYHLLQGYFVAIAGFILLFASSLALSKVRIGTPREAGREDSSRPGESYSGRSTNIPWLIAILSLLCIGWYMYFVSPAPVPLRQPLNGFPFSIGDWKGVGVSDGISPVRVPGARYELTRLYSKGSSRDALLYVGYLDAQTEDGGLVNDYFNDYYANIEEVTVPDIRGSIRLDKKVFRAGGRDYLALFWFDLNGKTFTNMRNMKVLTAYNGLIRGRTNGAVIMVMSEIKGHEDLEDAFHDGVTLVQAVRPLLGNYLPGDGVR